MNHLSNIFPNDILALAFQDVCHELDDDQFELAHSRFSSKPYITTTRIAALFVCRRVAWCSMFARLSHDRPPRRPAALRVPWLTSQISEFMFEICFFNGGFGITAGRILQTTLRITHLCLSLGISSTDSTRSLCKSLQCIQPRSGILNDFNNAYDNTHTRNLVASICSCMMEEWTRLVEFWFPYDIQWAWKEKEDNQHHLLEAMYNVPFLKIVHMLVPYKPDVLLPLLAKSSLCVIYSETPFGLIAGHHIKGATDQLSLQLLEICHKIYFPLPGPWAPAHRHYEALQADSTNLKLLFRVEPPL